MSPHFRPLLAAAAVALALAPVLLSPARAAGVKVTFPDAERYADAGATSWEREATQAELAAHLVALGQRLLPADLTLEVEVLEIDLAGTVLPTRRGDLRIVRGGADWPRLTLRYSLVKDGQVQTAATERLADLAYTMNLGSRLSSEPLRYEKRLLDDWFRERFAERLVAAVR